MNRINRERCTMGENGKTFLAYRLKVNEGTRMLL